MKTNPYRWTIFVLLFITAMGNSCLSYREKYHTVTIVMDSACKVEQQTAACEVIGKRIAAVWKVKEKTALINGQFDITYSGEDSLLTQILAQKGEIYIAETCQNNEIASSVLEVCKKMLQLMENTGEKPLWYTGNMPYYEPVLMRAPLQQVAFVDSVFNRSKNLFPVGISFYWTAKSKDGYYELLAIKPVRHFPLNSTSVKNSDLQKSNYYPGDEIYIELNEQYSKEWARLTRDNISRDLAFVMDGKVLMYPRVHSEIMGGKLSITGNFDNSELLLIKSFLSAGVLDCKAQIIRTGEGRGEPACSPN